MTIVASNSLTLSKVSDGVGVTSTVITYANSTSGTTAPSTGWTSSVPTLVKGQYLWTKTVWTYTDTSSKTGYSVTYISKDGTNGINGTSGIIVSSVAPASPQTGQLWQDTSTTPQLVKKWTGSSWVIWKMYVENMVVDTISSMSSDLGNVTAGTYTSWSYVQGPGGIYELNGIYIYEGRTRYISIKDPTTSDPNIAGVALNKIVSGYEIISASGLYYNVTMTYNYSANELLKSGYFWSQRNDTDAYIGGISSSRDSNNKKINISSSQVNIVGSLTKNDLPVHGYNTIVLNLAPNTAYNGKDIFASSKRLKIYGQIQNRRYFYLELDLEGPALLNPDIGYRPLSSSIVVGSVGEGVSNREWMINVGLNTALDSLLFKAYSRDGSGNWSEFTNNTVSIYKIIAVI